MSVAPSASIRGRARKSSIRLVCRGTASAARSCREIARDGRRSRGFAVARSTCLNSGFFRSSWVPPNRPIGGNDRPLAVWKTSPSTSLMLNTSTSTISSSVIQREAMVLVVLLTAAGGGRDGIGAIAAVPDRRRDPRALLLADRAEALHPVAVPEEHLMDPTVVADGFFQIVAGGTSVDLGVADGLLVVPGKRLFRKYFLEELVAGGSTFGIEVIDYRRQCSVSIANWLPGLEVIEALFPFGLSVPLQGASGAAIATDDNPGPSCGSGRRPGCFANWCC